MKVRFPVGGEREPVYNFLRHRGFVMTPGNDKHWKRADGVDLHLYGAGSMARVYAANGELLADGPLDQAAP